MTYFQHLTGGIQVKRITIEYHDNSDVDVFKGYLIKDNLAIYAEQGLSTVLINVKPVNHDMSRFIESEYIGDLDKGKHVRDDFHYIKSLVDALNDMSGLELLENCGNINCSHVELDGQKIIEYSKHKEHNQYAN
ncbi:hypothetical protein GGC02_09395 [Bacillus velezensis]|nr:hypothetical protein [Bacillus velezensis]MEE1864743.1 hypothetical protein [Bacillus velezensis]